LQPLDVGYFHVLKKHLLSLANGLGYASRRTMPRHVLPYLMKHALMKICPATVAAAFSATGIYPFNPRAVKVLTAKPKQNASLSQSDGPIVDSNTNILVKIGLVPEELATVFLDPPEIQKPKGNHTLKEARVVKSKDSHEGNTHKGKGKRKGKSVTPAVVGDIDQIPSCASPSSVVLDDTEALCVVCMTNRSLTWVGCDACDAWFHYECIPHSEQVDVDFSLVTGTRWFCPNCREE